ncbi:DHHC zinc finger domain-containing protein [Babesia ovis]|uniref:DHHC zinc finger domain-containing protein n=1 Tax=Babesia ovis TaxID=5869 RepID=A0A9W5TCZ3_BABOV|nr:DHHC zinc finger domain-containing protein [Babesia ovis]
MFALTLCIDQIFNIYRNTTAIDKLKRVAPRPQRFKQTMIHVFGCNPCWKWLLPLPSKPSYMGDKLTPSDILALSVFDDSDAVLPDYNHEFQDLFTESPTQRRWLPKCACFRRMTDTTNEV